MWNHSGVELDRTTEETKDLDMDAAALLAFKVWTYKQGELVSLMIHLGDRLGLYHDLAHAGPTTAGRWPTVLVYAHNTVARVLLGMAAGAGVAGYSRFLQRYGAINRIDLPVTRWSEAEVQAATLALDWSRASIGYCNRDPLAPTAGER